MTTPSPIPEPAVVVGLDGSTCSDLALVWALQRAASTGRGVRTVSCWSWPDARGLSGSVVVDEAGATAAASARQVARAVAFTGLEHVHVEQLVVNGPPGPALVDASVGADVLVIGSTGHHPLVAAVLGSVSRYCATHARLPVVLVKPPYLDLAPEVGTDAEQTAPA